MNEIKVLLNKIVDALNEHKVRATYGAIGKVIGVPAQSVGGMLEGGQCPRNSWVVNTEYETPTGYTQEQWHPDLKSSMKIIRSPESLRKLIK